MRNLLGGSVMVVLMLAPPCAGDAASSSPFDGDYQIEQRHDGLVTLTPGSGPFCGKGLGATITVRNGEVIYKASNDLTLRASVRPDGAFDAAAIVPGFGIDSAVRLRSIKGHFVEQNMMEAVVEEPTCKWIYSLHKLPASH